MFIFSKFSLILLFRIFASANAAHSEVPLEIKGIHLGISEEDLMKITPKVECKKSETLNADALCALQKFDDIPSSMETIGSAKVLGYDFYFLNNRLGTIVVHFWSRDFTATIAAFEEKFGKPKSTSTVVQNKLSAKYENHKFSWPRKNEFIEIEEFLEDMDHSFIMLRSAEYKKELDIRLKQKIKKDAQNL